MCFIILHNYHLLHIGINIWVFFCKRNFIHSIIWYFCALFWQLISSKFLYHMYFSTTFYSLYICKIDRVLACEHDHILTSCRMKIIYKKMYWSCFWLINWIGQLFMMFADPNIIYHYLNAHSFFRGVAPN